MPTFGDYQLAPQEARSCRSAVDQLADGGKQAEALVDDRGEVGHVLLAEIGERIRALGKDLAQQRLLRLLHVCTGQQTDESDWVPRPTRGRTRDEAQSLTRRLGLGTKARGRLTGCFARTYSVEVISS